MTSIFFYGLFMDVDLLRGKGLNPGTPIPAKLPGYRIHIGNRATLIENPGSIAYGMLIELPQSEALALYSAPDVCDYIAQDVNVVLLTEDAVRPSVCYLLPRSTVIDAPNQAYAKSLAALVLALGFPTDYAREIRQ